MNDGSHLCPWLSCSFSLRSRCARRMPLLSLLLLLLLLLLFLRGFCYESFSFCSSLSGFLPPKKQRDFLLAAVLYEYPPFFRARFSSVLGSNL